ncbi:protein expanded [Culicoides brevitarsis]|uniref:protein expanded n=1 Tax=Culicoides brevitarsis TaxID=469753 RepID=UPI00307C834A
MRALCTVSAPLEVCAPPSQHRPLQPGARFLALRLLGTPQPRTLYFLVEAKSRVREVYAQTCHHFSKQGMLDTELFGLAVLIDGEYLFTDPESKLSKYGPKSWRSSHTHGLDANGKPLLELHFRVQFYVESPLMLRDEVSRHNYYLQLKSNATLRDIKDCPDQSLLMLGGLALQADLGDFSEESSGDIKHDEYLPPHLRVSWAQSTLISCYRENRRMSRADAETHFIRAACALNEAINTHIFRMRANKNETGNGSVQLVIYAKGIKIFMENHATTTFLWPGITKLSFDRKKFEIRSGENKILLYSANDDKNKMLLALCRETHQFSMKIAPRLTEAIKREEEESNCMHACYLYSRALNLPYKNKSDQRISVISSTSSNTTSGIVSDRVHSEDELEILLNGQERTVGAPSTESLALAHLLDCPSVSRQTSSVGQVSIKEIEETGFQSSTQKKKKQPWPVAAPAELPETSVDQGSNKDLNDSSDSLPNSGHNIGSQCSSTCSTIVVATDAISLPPVTCSNGSLTNGHSRRQTSTSSSLELGFSHTAQNSAVSEAIPAEEVINGNEDEQDAMYTSAPAPTETSGVYTMNSSEITGQSSEVADEETESHEASSHYGCFMPSKSEVDSCNLDSVDGDFRPLEENAFRDRSDSNVSGSGSFRGDGSDPADTKHPLLSAEELTDLIVGRGTYPLCKTVSHTMDSDSDYVTLPLSLEGESYLQGSEDTAPTEEDYNQKMLLVPPTVPKRIDSDPNRSLSSVVKSMSPPPYHGEHFTTGLKGPDIQAKTEKPPQYHVSHVLPTPPKPVEEANARFITTKPHINILKAHTSVVTEPHKPSYAAPTQSVTTLSHNMSPNLTSATTIGIPIVPYVNQPPHRSMSVLSQPPRFIEPNPTCVLLPVIKPRRRQPPPPPSASNQLATVYASQLARSQIELYQQQLYSDVDYVIYPLQDPAISQQEYLDAKQGSILATMAAQAPQAPPYLAYHTVRAHNRSWDACKNHSLYRSTPYLSMAYSNPSRYASSQNLSDTYVQLPGTYSPIYSPSVTSLCSSYDIPPPPLRPSTIATNATIFARSRSDENLLNGDVNPNVLRKPRRMPPPPPPYSSRTMSSTYKKPALPTPIEDDKPPAVPAKPARLKRQQEELAKQVPIVPSPSHAKSPLRTENTITTTTTSAASTTVTTTQPAQTNGTSPPAKSQIDINTLREKSKHLDLPLISALCNDQSLLKQTRAFVMPKHPKMGLNQMNLMPKGKYPVSGLNTTQMQHKNRGKNSMISHRHPNDKLPPLPSVIQLAEGNNYVMDPTPAAKHKSYSSAIQQSTS